MGEPRQILGSKFQKRQHGDTESTERSKEKCLGWAIRNDNAYVKEVSTRVQKESSEIRITTDKAVGRFLHLLLRSEELAARQILMNRGGGLPSGAHGQDDRCTAGHDVTPGKDTLL